MVLSRTCIMAIITPTVSMVLSSCIAVMNMWLMWRIPLPAETLILAELVNGIKASCSDTGWLSGLPELREKACTLKDAVCKKTQLWYCCPLRLNGQCTRLPSTQPTPQPSLCVYGSSSHHLHFFRWATQLQVKFLKQHAKPYCWFHKCKLISNTLAWSTSKWQKWKIWHHLCDIGI